MPIGRNRRKRSRLANASIDESTAVLARKMDISRRIAQCILIASSLAMVSPAFATTPEQARHLFLSSTHKRSSLEKLEAAAKSGNAAAEDWLGLAYLSGSSKGLPRDYSRALIWFSRAVAKGSANAAFNLGSMYQVGAGVPQNYRKARHWYAMAADRGSLAARYSLTALRELAAIPGN